MKQAFIQAHSEGYSVRRVCSAFGFSRSSHYAVSRRHVTQTERDAPLVDTMQTIHAHRYKRHYGSPRMTAELRELGFVVNHKRVARLMAQHGLSAQAPKKRVKTTDSGHRLAVADNVLARDFQVGCGRERWVSDITYLRVWGGFVYLAAVLDVNTRAWLGYAVDTHLRTSLLEEALQMATEQSAVLPELFHADRGSQYASDVFRQALKKLNTRLSMSRKGNCWDNAVAESFFATLKREVADTFMNLDDAKGEVFDFFCFYNQERRHSSLGQTNPQTYEKELHSNPRIVA